MHEQIQQRMAELGISQSELARRAGVSAAYVSQVVNGQRGKRMSIETADKLARGLKVTPKFFSRLNKQMLIRGGRSG